MTTATYTEPRFVIVNARGEFADDLGASPIFAAETAAEEAIESLAASGFDLDGYSARELTTNDLVGDERDAMLAACRAEGREAAERELTERGELAPWSDFASMTSSWDALKATLLARFGVGLYRGHLDEAVSAYRAGRESVLLPSKTEVTYSVSYRAPSNADESTRNTLDTEPAEGVSLDDVIEICRITDADAELFDAAGSRKGWVYPNGTYTLR